MSMNRWRLKKIHVVEYYSDKKLEILPFVTTWTEQEDIMPSKTSQKNSSWPYLYVECKTVKHTEEQNRNCQELSGGRKEEIFTKGYGVLIMQNKWDLKTYAT